jgi:cyclophilin family peptidyl-prolyl cis-trans isomerase
MFNVSSLPAMRSIAAMEQERHAYCSLNSSWSALLAAALIAAASGCNRDGAETTTDPVASTTGAVESPSKRPGPKPIDRIHPVVVVETSEGAIKIRLDADISPGTVRNFLNYVNEGFYDNTLIHYVDSGKMIVAGGYAADRTLKPARQSIRNEAHNGAKNTRGSVAMARDASLIDSATSQFFINLVDAPQRDYQGDTAAQYGYCVFGEVTEGLEIAQEISQSPTTNLADDLAQTPDPAVVIKSIRIVQ